MLSDLIQKLDVDPKRSPDRRGEYHGVCPHCGKRPFDSFGHPATHFSFSANGFRCFVCHEKGSLNRLLKVVGGELTNHRPKPMPIRKKPVKRPFNMTLTEYTRQYTNGDLGALWSNYKSIPLALINHHHLGYGVLPRSRCNHPRLLVPIFEGDKVHCLRGRAINCDCGKWLVSGGFKPENLPLFNANKIKGGDIAIIGENPIDAILGTFKQEKTQDLILPQMTANELRALINGNSVVVTATLSVSYWNDSWIDKLRDTTAVYVAYDNDLPGNGGGVEGMKKRKQLERDGKRFPPAKGIELTNKLRGKGINAKLLKWYKKPLKYDLGDYYGSFL